MTSDVESVKATVRELIAIKGEDYKPPTTGMYVWDDSPCCVVAQVFDQKQEATVALMEGWDALFENTLREIAGNGGLEFTSGDYTAEALDFLTRLQFFQDINYSLGDALSAATVEWEACIKQPTMA